MNYEVLKQYMNYCKFMSKTPTFDGLKDFNKIIIVK